MKDLRIEKSAEILKAVAVSLKDVEEKIVTIADLLVGIAQEQEAAAEQGTLFAPQEAPKIEREYISESALFERAKIKRGPYYGYKVDILRAAAKACNIKIKKTHKNHFLVPRKDTDRIVATLKELHERR